MRDIFALILISSTFTGAVMLLLSVYDKRLGNHLSPKKRTTAASFTLLLQPLMLAIATALSFAMDIFGRAGETVSESDVTATIIDSFIAPVTITEATTAAIQDSTVGTTVSYSPDFGLMFGVLACLWLAGVAVTALYKIVSYLRFVHNLRKSLTPCDCGASIPAFTSSQAQSPFLMGFFRAKIILPEKQMDEEELRLAVRHEMIHHKRHDIQKKFFAEMLKSLNWFNPAFYAFANKLSELSELTVDEILSSDLDHTGRKAYGGLLLKFASTKEEPVLCTDLSKGAKSLAERLRLIMEDEKRKTTKGEKIALGVLAAVTLAIIGVSVGFCMTAVPTVVTGLEIGADDSEIIKIDLSNEGTKPYQVDQPVNPFIGANLSGSSVYISRYGYGDLTEPVLMDEEDTAEFISYLESADMDARPTIDENSILGGHKPTYTLILSYGKEYTISLIGYNKEVYYIEIDNVKYVIDDKSYDILSSYYMEVYCNDVEEYYGLGDDDLSSELSPEPDNIQEYSENSEDNEDEE